LQMGGRYNKYKVANAFKDRVIEMDLLQTIAKDIADILGEKRARRPRK